MDFLFPAAKVRIFFVSCKSFQATVMNIMNLLL